MEHAEEMLFTWDSGFGNDQLGVTEDVLGDNGTISHTPQSIRYTPQKVNRQDGNEMVGVTRNEPSAPTCRTSSTASAVRASSRTARSTSDSAFPSPAAWRWKATGSGARCAGTPAKEEIV